MAAPAHVEEWTGRDVSVGEIESRLAELRQSSEAEDHGPDLRTSVMTHMAWVPKDWREIARNTLAGLAERHPSRTILLVPDPGSKRDAIDAEVSLTCFPLGEERHVCTEVIELRLCGARAMAPASIVAPLLLSDLPAFLRWRGRPPFARPEFEQLADLVDRIVVDSAEWPDVPAAYAELRRLFERVAVSDIAWARTLEWRRSLAELWPVIAEAKEIRIAAPAADATLLHAWLCTRLDRAFELVHDDADRVELVAVDGHAVTPPRVAKESASDLLSAQLDEFGRDPVYERSCSAAAPA
jgi:glucose-6-phosphate dehydrogenase assembly protein OpcA